LERNAYFDVGRSDDGLTQAADSGRHSHSPGAIYRLCFAQDRKVNLTLNAIFSRIILCAFDLLELDGHDFRQWLFEERKRVLANLLRRRRAASKSPPSSGPQPTAGSSAASKLPKQRASLIWRC
jgi:hypothetical protein